MSDLDFPCFPTNRNRTLRPPISPICGILILRFFLLVGFGPSDLAGLSDWTLFFPTCRIQISDLSDIKINISESDWKSGLPKFQVGFHIFSDSHSSECAILSVSVLDGLPTELKEHCYEMRELDERVEKVLAQIRAESRDLFDKYDELPVEERQARYRKIKEVRIGCWLRAHRGSLGRG